MDWTDPTISELAEEREVETSSLAAGFATRMRKRAANAQGETTPCSEGPDDKCFKQSGPAEEVQIIPVVIFMDSLKRASSALPDLEGDAREGYASLEDGAPTGEPPLDGEVANEALRIEEAIGPLPWAIQHCLALYGARRTRPPNKLILGSYVKSLKWSRSSTDTSAPDQEVAQLHIRKCNPFDKRDSPIAHMCDLYPHSLCVIVVSCLEEYFISLPNYMDKGSYQHVTEDGMYIRNHDFDETTELVWLNF